MSESAAFEKKIQSLTENLLDTYEELDLIYRITRGVMASPGIQEMVQLILDEAVETMLPDLACVLPVAGGERAFEAVHHRVPTEVTGFLAEQLLPQIIERGRSKLYYDLRKELELPSGGEFPEAFLVCVMQTDDVVFGALCLGRKPGRDSFTAGDKKLADALVSQAAVAIENAQLHQKRLEQEQARIRMEEELRLARSIQKKLLPNETPRLVGYELAGTSRPAQSVGGDYYDFVPMDDGKVAVCLGDVSGKGMPAALLMAHLQATIRGQTILHTPPGLCLSYSNRLLYQSTDVDRFATCFYGVLDTESHRLCYSNAGHDHPILVGAGGNEDLNTGGIVLGVLGEADYEEATLSLELGDVLVLYSDGIIDAANTRDEEFGVDRLNQLLKDSRDASAPMLLERVLGTVSEYAKDTEPVDDMTLVVIRRTG